MRRWIVALAVVALGGVAGCGTGPGDEGGGSSVFPDGSLQDWVSYADHVATYTVVAEREDGRMADYTLRVDRVVWSAPNAPPLPSRIENRFLNGELDVGDHHLGPLVLVEFTQGPEWWPLQTESRMSLDDGELDAGGDSTTTARALDGKSLAEVVELLNAQRPSALAIRYADMRPQDRVQAVMHEEETGTPLRVEHLRPVRDCTLGARPRCDDPELWVSSTADAWLSFDLSHIPKSATVHEAILWLPELQDLDRRHQRISLRDGAGRMVNEGQTLGAGSRGDWSMVKLVAAWVDGSSKNRGVRVRFETPRMRPVAFSSSEGRRAPDLEIRWSP